MFSARMQQSVFTLQAAHTSQQPAFSLYALINHLIKSQMYVDEFSESAGDILVGAESIRMSGMLAQPGEREMRD